MATDETTLSTTRLDGADRVLPVCPDAIARRRARLLLLAVCLGVVLVHVLATDLTRPIHWDESVHFTQVLRDGRPAVFFEPHRTRGMSLLAAPIGFFDPSMLAFRAYLLIAGAVGTYVAFATWIPSIGVGAPLAAAVYSAHWVTVFYTVELLPNHPSALIAVGLAGLVARALGGDHRGLLVWGPPLVVLHGLVRPPDAVVAGLGLAIVLLVVLRSTALRVLAALMVAGVVSLVPWIVEGWVRFRLGPLETVRSAGEYAGSAGGFNQLGVYLANLEDRVRCVGSCQQAYLDARAEQGWLAMLPPGRTLAVLLIGAAFATVALVRRGRSASAAVVPAAALMAFYSVFGGAVNLRYIMPVVALTSLATAIGAVVAWQWSSRLPQVATTSLRLVGGLLLVIALVWQVAYGVGRLDSPGATRVRAAAIGMHIAEVVGDDACTLLTPISYPSLQYWTGCRATLLRLRDGRIQPPLGELHSYVNVAERARRGDRLFALVRREPAADSPLSSWRRVPGEPWEGYALYEWDGTSPIPEPPCPPAVGPERTLGRVLSAGC